MSGLRTLVLLDPENSPASLMLRHHSKAAHFFQIDRSHLEVLDCKDPAVTVGVVAGVEDLDEGCDCRTS